MAFSPADLDAAVKQAFATASDIPPDHRGAFLTIANQDGVTAVLAHKLSDAPDSWVVTADVSHPWTGGLDYGVTIQKTW